MDTPRYIYKYHKLNVYFFELLTSKKFYLASREELNDPFDLSISLNKETYRNFFLVKYPHFEKDISTMNNTISLFEYYRTHDKVEYYKRIKDVIPQEHEAYRTTCFTLESNNPLMWSHYTDNHQGVCIKFDLSKDEILRNSVVPIKYLKKVPEIKQVGDIKKLLFVKENSWGSEKELRIVSNRNEFAFNRDTIKEIVFGINTPNNIISWFSYLAEGVSLSDVILSKLQIKGNKLVKVDGDGEQVNIKHFRPKVVSKAEREKWKFL